MVKRLTQHQLEIITDLWQAVDGQAHDFVPADTLPYSPLYWLAHECRGLIMLRKTKRKGKVYRKIALTESGVIWCDENGIYARTSIPESLMPLADKRQRTTITFQVEVTDDLVGQVGECKKQKAFIPVIRLAMQLYGALGYEGMAALTKSTLHNFDIFQMSPDEIVAAYEELENERARLTFEQAALAAQTLEVKQFHDMFRNIDNKLDSLQNARIPADNAPVRGLQPVSGSTQANGLKALSVPNFAPPPIEDDDDEDTPLFTVVESEIDTKQIALNFLSSVMKLHEDEGVG